MDGRRDAVCERWRGAAAVFVALAMLAAVACGPTRAERIEELSDPLRNPDFLTPVAEAEDAGVTVYWMGAEFQAGDLLFKLSPVADLSPNGTGLAMDYAANTTQGAAAAFLRVYAKGSSGPREWRRRALAVPGASTEGVGVGAWEGELFLLPGAPRPVNHLLLFVDLGDTVAVVQAASGETGVPGTDPNPLIDRDLLIQVVAEHLRPYPE
jgi:hypothetical protein